MASSNSVDALFARCRAEGRAALIPYLTCGFPTAEHTRRVLPALVEAGCDMIELGVPFSDPIADGPTIQRSSTIALERGMTLDGVLAILREFRAAHSTPVILFGALNPYLARGLDVAARMAAEAGAQGILAADLPAEEAGEFRPHLEAHGLHLITLVAPTTPNDRVRLIAGASSGFLYCISLKGTTGGTAVSGDATDYLARLRQQTDLPLALGFGISRPEHVRLAVDSGADGVVVGSALVAVMGEAAEQGRDVVQAAVDFIRPLAAELKRRAKV